MGKRGKLTEKQKRFADEYLIDLDAKHAAIRAGYSRKTAEQIGYALLQKPHVAELIQSKVEARAERVAIQADTVLAELYRIAMAGDGDEHIRTPDKLRALELCGKHLKLFTDKVETSGEVTLVVETGVPRTPGDA